MHSLERKQKAKHSTLNTIYLHLTTRCNLNCSFCAIPDRNEKVQELTKFQIFDLLSEAKELGTTYVVLIGGEPFLRKDLGEIVKSIISRGFRLGISTNGTLLNFKSLSWVKYVPSSSYFLGISLDGAKPFTHNRLRRRKDAFEKTLKGIEIAYELGIQLTLQTVLQKSNKNELLDIASIAAKFGADYNVIPDIVPKGAGIHVKSNKIDIHEILNKAKELYKYGCSIGIKAQINLPPALQEPDRFQKSDMACYWGKHFCGILPNGDVAMCHGCDFCNIYHGNLFIAGNIHNQSLREVWELSKTFNNLREIDPDNFKGVCGRCVLRKFCRGYCRIRAYLEYGSILAPDILCQEAFENNLFPRYMLSG